MMKLAIFFLLSILIFGEEGIERKNYILRPVYGKASYSSFMEIIKFEEHSRDEQGGTLAGIQLEKYIARDIWNDSVDFTIFSSILHHNQDIEKFPGKYTQPRELSGKDTYQLNAGIKIYWKKFPWNNVVRTRIGLGEGLSYVKDRLDIEIQNSNRDNDKNDAHILNYLDVTLSFNMRDITRWEELEHYYMGMGISHRSGIEGLISGVDGGSNYWTFFIEAEL